MLVHQMYVKYRPGTSVILPLITSMPHFHFTTVSQAKPKQINKCLTISVFVAKKNNISSFECVKMKTFIHLTNTSITIWQSSTMLV